MTETTPSSKRRWSILASIVAVIGVAYVSVTTPVALGAFVASITNSNDTAASGALTLKVANSAGTVSCSSASTSVSSDTATCSTINIYAGATAMLPGSSVTNSITVTNTGSVRANTVSAVFGSCTQTAGSGSYGSATDLCNQLLLTVQVTQGGTTTTISTAGTTPASANALNPTLSPLGAGASDTFTYTLSMPSTLSTAYANLSISEPATYSLAS